MRFLAVALLAFPVLAADWSPRAAADYLDARQKEWLAWPSSNLADGKKCVSCHTGLTYMLARPALRRALNENSPTEYETALLDSLRSRVSKRAPLDLYPKATEPHLSEQAAVESVLAAMLLHSSESLDRMWTLQSPTGAWAWSNFYLDPGRPPHPPTMARPSPPSPSSPGRRPIATAPRPLASGNTSTASSPPSPSTIA